LIVPPLIFKKRLDNQIENDLVSESFSSQQIESLTIGNDIDNDKNKLENFHAIYNNSSNSNAANNLFFFTSQELLYSQWQNDFMLEINKFNQNIELFKRMINNTLVEYTELNGN